MWVQFHWVQYRGVQFRVGGIPWLPALVYAQLEEFKGKEEELLMIEGKVIVLFNGDKVKLLNSFPYVGTGLQLMDSLTGKYYRQKRAVE